MFWICFAYMLGASNSSSERESRPLTEEEKARMASIAMKVYVAIALVLVLVVILNFETFWAMFGERLKSQFSY